MSEPRKAHTVEIIDRRLRDCEAGGVGDVMELVGLHDELARVERKWLAVADARRNGTGRKRDRPQADAAALNARFDRLKHLVDAALRRAGGEPAERKLLEAAAVALRNRPPLPTG